MLDTEIWKIESPDLKNSSKRSVHESIHELSKNRGISIYIMKNYRVIKLCYVDTHRVDLAGWEVCSPHYRLQSKQSRYTICQVLIQQM